MSTPVRARSSRASRGRAFRRPVTRERSRLSFSDYVSLARKQGDSFEEGIATALQAILVSPNFLFRIERDRPAPAGRTSVPVSDYELASRLSYFLWSSMPDEELLRVAGQGTLAAARRPGRPRCGGCCAIRSRARWWRTSPASGCSSRTSTWSGRTWNASRCSTRACATRCGARPSCSSRTSSGKTAASWSSSTPNYTFLNERLARFYGIPGVTGPEFRRVDMSGTERGGGILAHASVLTVSSYSTRTSPVLRGKWILENLLNAPPPPPPPGVPPLDDTKVGQSGTLRQQMEEHRKNPACCSCHSRMDPLGFGLENFNAIGAWRTEDGKFPVDASGALPGWPFVPRRPPN